MTLVGERVVSWLMNYSTALLRIFVASTLVVPLLIIHRKWSDWVASRVPKTNQQLAQQLKSGVSVLLVMSILLGIGYILQIPVLKDLLPASLITTVVGAFLVIAGTVFFSTIYLVETQRYESGDIIEIPGLNLRGQVKSVSLLCTSIRTVDNATVVLSHRDIWKRDIINHSINGEPEHRLSINVLVTYESEIQQAQEIIEEAAREVDGVKQGTEWAMGEFKVPTDPMCQVSEFRDSGILLVLRYWVREPCLIPSVKSEIMSNIEGVVKETQRVDFAYPHTHLWVDENTGELPIRLRNSSD